MNTADKLFLGSCALVVVLCLLAMAYCKRKEIDAYNHVIGSKISYSDGFWLDLKIVNPATTTNQLAR